VPQRQRILAGCDFKRYRDKTITTLEAYMAELDRTREQGYGQDREEFDDHIRCVGVPIFDRHNQAVAGLSVSTPTFRFDEARESEIVALLQDASRVISKQLGCTNHPIALPEPTRR
jgi:IclR family KDG regulon transcriptional repressor